MKKLLILLAFSCLIGIAKCPPCPVEAYSKYLFEGKKHLFFETIYNKPFDPELLKEALIYCEIQAPDIVYRQAYWETGNFSSELLWVANNCMGMRLPAVRETTAIGEFKYHAKYKHWIDSVKDYKLLQEWYLNRGYRLVEYYSFLEEINYATDKNYITKLKSISGSS